MRFVPTVFAICLLAASIAPAQAAVDPALAAREIDAIMTKHWQAKQATPNPPASDEVFLRRLYLDLAGRIPTAREAEEFLASKDADKRSKLAAQLLGSEAYVQRFFHLWADVLRLQSRARVLGTVTGSAWSEYLKRSLRENKPYDQLVREMLTSKGTAAQNGAIGFYVRDTGMPLDHAALTAREFLGTRIECAQCHDHPFDSAWTQLKFYQMAAFTYGFTEGDYYGNIGLRRVFGDKYKAIEAEEKKARSRKDDAALARAKAEHEQMNRNVRGVVTVLNELHGPFLGNNTEVGFKPASLKLPHDYQYSDAKPFDVVKPKTAFGPSAASQDGWANVEAYAAWMTSPQNPRFTTVVTNRLWRALFGRALIETLDDLHDNTAADIPELQAYLNKLLIQQKYDMKAFLGVLVRTRAYQAEVTTQELFAGEPYDFRGPLLRRMTAEQVYDSFVTLMNPSPDAVNPFAREEGERALRESARADAMFRAVPPEELYDMAVAASKVLAEQAAALKAMQAKINEARKAGDTELAKKLGKEADQIDRRKWQAINDQVVVPLLSRLLKRPVEMKPTTARNAILETVRNARVPGIDDTSPAAEAATHEALVAGFKREAAFYKLSDKETGKYVDERLKQLKEWPRSADVESPAPRGHYLRAFGQSDRETIDNANPEANIAQALLLMNSDLIPKATAPRSQLMLAVGRAGGEAAKFDAVCLAVLSRHATAKERQKWAEAKARGLSVEDFAAALLHTRQFLFIQ